MSAEDWKNQSRRAEEDYYRIRAAMKRAECELAELLRNVRVKTLVLNELKRRIKMAEEDLATLNNKIRQAEDRLAILNAMTCENQNKQNSTEDTEMQ